MGLNEMYFNDTKIMRKKKELPTEWTMTAPFFQFNSIEAKDIFKAIVTRDPSIPISFDTETTGLDCFNDRIIGFSVAVRINKEGKADNNGITKAVWVHTAKMQKIKRVNLMLTILKRGLLLMHNKKYDEHMLQNEGIDVDKLGIAKRTKCTMLTCYQLNTNELCGLDAVTPKFLKRGTIPHKKLIKDHGSFTDTPPEMQCIYACHDAANTLDLYYFLKKEKAKIFNSLTLEIQHKASDVLRKMERRGILLDVKFFEDNIFKLTKELEIKKQEIYSIAGEQFNIGSTQQTAKILFEKLNLPVIKRSKKTKKPSADAGVLETLGNKHRIAKLIRIYRQIDKGLTGYAVKLPKDTDADGLIRTSFSLTTAPTFRLASSKPNMQSVSKRGILNAQKGFKPKEDYYFLRADYSQIEFRIFCYLANIEPAIAGFLKKEDQHIRVSSLVYGCKTHEVTPKMRDDGKTINFGILYGMGPWSLAARLGISVDEAEVLLEKYFKVMPGAEEWIECQKELCRKRGYIQMIYGTTRYIYGMHSNNNKVRSKAERGCINTIMQGSAGEVMKIALIKLDKVFLKSKLDINLILTVHDDVLCEVHKSIPIEKASKLIKTAMEFRIKSDIKSISKVPINIPFIPVEVGYSDVTWGDIEALKEKKEEKEEPETFKTITKLTFIINDLEKKDLDLLKELGNNVGKPAFLNYKDKVIDLKKCYDWNNIQILKKEIEGFKVIGKN